MNITSALLTESNTNYGVSKSLTDLCSAGQLTHDGAPLNGVGLRANLHFKNSSSIFLLLMVSAAQFGGVHSLMVGDLHLLIAVLVASFTCFIFNLCSTIEIKIIEHH